jgi:hypothetical protein
MTEQQADILHRDTAKLYSLYMLQPRALGTILQAVHDLTRDQAETQYAGALSAGYRAEVRPALRDGLPCTHDPRSSTATTPCSGPVVAEEGLSPFCARHLRESGRMIGPDIHP